MKLTAEELKELELIKDFTGYDYVIEPLPEPLTVGVETHRIAVYKTVNGTNTYRPIITATDDEELASRTKAVLANMTARHGEILTYLLNKRVSGDFYVAYWPEIGNENHVWYTLRRGDKIIATMLDQETLVTLVHALERVL